MKRRLLAIAMAMVMAMSLLPVSALAAEGNEEDLNPASRYYNLDGTEITDESKQASAGIVLTKIAVAVTGEENTYNVTMTVKAKDDVTPAESHPAHVVLVIDASGSMANTKNSNLNSAKQAANAFLDVFLGDSKSEGNKAAVVSYSDNAVAQTGLTDDLDAAKGAVNKITANGGTNIQAGIYCAQTLLDADKVDGVENVIVLLSDGYPTYCYELTGVGEGNHIGTQWDAPDQFEVTGRDTSKLLGSGSDDGIGLFDGLTNLRVTCECNETGLLHKHEDDYRFERELKYDYETNSLLNAFAKIDTATGTLWEADHAKAAETTIYSILLGKNTDAESLMKKISSSNTCNTVTDADDLADLFKGIAEAYTPVVGTVTDPMGEDVALIASSLEEAQGVTVAEDGKSYTWALDANNAEPDNDGYRTYTLTYQVTVEPGDDFNYSVTHPLNGRTTFTYGENKELEFNVPTVKLQAPSEPEPKYTVTYDWGTDCPSDATLPTDKTTYESVDEAKAAVNTTYTSGYTSNAPKDGQDGTWTFSGWDGGEVSGTVVTFTGEWTFKSNEVDPDPDPIPGPTSTDVFYYINLPHKSSTLSDYAEDYRFLTYGGRVSDDASSTVIKDIENEKNVTKNIGTWTTNDLMPDYPQGSYIDSEGHMQSYSAAVGEGSTWELDRTTGKVTSFTIVIDGTKYSNEAANSTDGEAYGIRWAKFSPNNASFNDSEGKPVAAPHLDGILYKKADITEVVTAEDVVTALKKQVAEFPENPDDSYTFAFVLKKTAGMDYTTFEDINLTATVPANDNPVHLDFAGDDDEKAEAAKIELTPGTYEVEEKLTDEQKNVWAEPTNLKFDVNTDGTISYEKDENDEDITTITNTHKVPSPDPEPVSELSVEKTLTDPAITKDPETQEDIIPSVTSGDTITWTITVKNTGSEDLTGITLTDHLSGAKVYDVDSPEKITETTEALDLTTYSFDLASGKSKTFIAQYTTTDANIGNSIVNSATAAVKDGPSDTSDPTPGVEVEPDRPDRTDLEAEANALVNVGCTNEAVSHKDDPKTFALINGTYTVGNVEKDTGGDYTCDITIGREQYSAYVAAYNTAIGGEHVLDDEDASKTITLTWDTDTKAWTAPEALPTIGVKCGLTSPDKPTEGTISALVKARLDCVSTDADAEDHGEIITSLVKGTDTIGTVTEDQGTYTVTVTVQPLDAYAFLYTLASGYEHSMVTTEAQSVTLTWDPTVTDEEENVVGAWTTGSTEECLYVRFEVTCGELDPGQDDPKCVVIYDPNGGTGGPGTDSNLPVGDYTLLKTPVPTHSSMTVDGVDVPVVFIGWTEAQDTKIYEDSDEAPTTIDTIRITTDETTVYAVWGYDTNGNGTADVLETKYTVRYIDGVSGAAFAEQSYSGLLYGTATPTFVGTPSRNGYTFNGWTPSVADTVTGNATYTAKWTKNTTTDTGNTDNSSDEPYKPGEGPGGSGSGSSDNLNREDHFSYIIGYKDGTLRPNGNITRGEVATIFFRLLTDDAREDYWSQTNGYSDVAPDKWCNNAISTLSNMGIIDGYLDGTFRPDGNITRAEFAKMAVNFFDYTVEEYQGYFPDVDEDSWYAGYVEAAKEMKLIEGYIDGTFQPNKPITRAEACTIVNRTLGRNPDEDHMAVSGRITWPDCNPGDWYYEAMMEATNSHDYTWVTIKGEKIEEWTEKLEQRDWAALEKTWSTAHSAPGGEVVQ